MDRDLYYGQCCTVREMLRKAMTLSSPYADNWQAMVTEYNRVCDEIRRMDDEDEQKGENYV